MSDSSGAGGPEPSAVEGVLLKVDYHTVEGRTWLRLWVKDPATGRVASYLDADFDPYFWVLAAADADPDDVAAGLRALRVGDIRAEDVRVESRAWEREERDALRVILKHPGHTPPMREAARRVPGVEEVLEADIPFASRYLIDRGLRPLDGVRFRARRDERAEEPLVADVVAYSLDAEAPLRVLAFDLEVRNPRVVPDPQHDPVVLISLATGDGRVEVLRAEERPADARDEPVDRALLERFVDFVRREDPDVFFTYNGDGFDWPYLEDRARVLDVALDVGRHARAPHPGQRAAAPDIKQAGPNKVVDVPGRLNLDLLRVAARDLPEVKVKTLENVAEALGVLARDERVHVPKDEIASYWDDPELKPTLVAYAADDARATLGLGLALLPQQAEFARAIRQGLDDVARMGRGRQVDFFLLAEGHRRGILAPNRGGADVEVYEGGFVLEPVPGLHEDVVALDFSAMYPTLMIGFNLSPDTFVGTLGREALEAREGVAAEEGRAAFAARDAEGRPVWVAPEVGHAFLQEPEGFFTSILRDLVGRRRGLKAGLRTLTGPARDLANVRQNSLKVLTNAFYGYMGWSQARWYSRECAEATAAWGRHTIRAVMRLARERGITVLYGDTDSIFVKEHEGVKDFVAAVNRAFPLELEEQERFEVLFFTGAKKRYAGLTRSGEIVARGLEVRRGDWCDLAKDTQREVLDTVLRARDPEAAAARVREVIEDLREGRVPVERLTIHKTLTMLPEHYKVRQAHAAAVVRAMAEHPGYRVAVGAKVRFVIVKPKDERATRDGVGLRASSAPRGAAAKGGRGERAPAVRESAKARASDAARLTERAKLVDFVEDDDVIDADYYVEKQVLPATLRILEHFGFTEDDLQGRPKQRSLFEF